MSRFSGDDAPYSTDIILQEGAAGNTDIGPIIVFDGVENARVGLQAYLCIDTLVSCG